MWPGKLSVDAKMRSPAVEPKPHGRVVAYASIWFPSHWKSLLSVGEFFGHLPRTLIDLNSSMSALPCMLQLRLAGGTLASQKSTLYEQVSIAKNEPPSVVGDSSDVSAAETSARVCCQQRHEPSAAYRDVNLPGSIAGNRSRESREQGETGLRTQMTQRYPQGGAAAHSGDLPGG